MQRETVESRKKNVSSRVGFSLLYKKFRAKVVLGFFLTIVITTLSLYLNSVSNRIIGSDEGRSPHLHNCGHAGCTQGTSIHLEDDSAHNSPGTKSDEKNEEYERYLPFWNYWKIPHFLGSIGRNQFVAITFLLLLIYSSSSYFSSLLEKEITTESYFYLKGILLKKFWKLGLEQKKENTHELKILLENEVELISQLWEHLPAHFLQSISTILILGGEKLLRIKDAGFASSVFFLVVIILYVALYMWLSNSSIRRYEVYKEMADKELITVDRQVSNAQLIENMGLTSSHESLRNEYARKTLLSEKKFDKSMSLLAITISFLPDCYRYLSPWFTNHSIRLRTVLSNVAPFFLISNSLKDFLDCYKEYGKYRLACARIGRFLAIQEREENLEKRSIVGPRIEEILLVNIDFKYSSGKQLILANYSKRFSAGTINKVSGGNGTGKTTILYLILGVIKPLSGEVLVKFSNGKTMNLHREINLYEWREKIALYLSHDNLIREGSTGQRQLVSISENLSQRRNSQVLIFDEATNALDNEKQKFIAVELKKMINEGRIIIFVQHKTNRATS